MNRPNVAVDDEFTDIRSRNQILQYYFHFYYPILAKHDRMVDLALYLHCW